MQQADSKRASERKIREQQEVMQQLKEIEAMLIDVPSQSELLEELRRIATSGNPSEARSLLDSVQRVLAPLQ